MVDAYFAGHCSSCIVVVDEQLAAKFCLPHQHYAVCIRYGRYICNTHNTIHDQLSIHQGRHGQPGKEFKDGMRVDPGI